MVGSTFGPRGFWPGPIPAHGVPSDCTSFDRIYELRQVQREIDAGPVGDVLDWPVELGASFADRNGLAGYQPLDGDLPLMRGDHYLWWINNDLGNLQSDPVSNPLGVEMVNEAWGFDAVGAVGDMTFYRHSIVNKGRSTISDMYVGLWADIDLGDFGDDATGSDSTLSLAYFYTANESDGVYGSPGPAFGFTFLEAYHSAGGLPSNVGSGPETFLTAITGPRKGGQQGEWPRTTERYYRFMRGLLPDSGEPMRAWGQGWEGEGPVTRYVFHGDPVSGEGWSERNLDGQGTTMPGFDKRIMGSFGPFELAPGDTASFTHAYVWAVGDDHLDSVTELKVITNYLHDVKAALMSARFPEPRFIDGNPPEEPQFPFWIDEPYPNPADNRLSLRSSFSREGRVVIRVSDALGRTRISEIVQIDEAGQRTITIDISGLTPGSYTVLVQGPSRHTSHPFVVLR